MRYIEGTSRKQIFLFNECLDEIIDNDNIVRFIDAYVESLEMQKLGFKMPKGTTGTLPYRPQLKLKIYIYGYFEKIRTSRRLEKECNRNKEMIWLTNGLAPDFKTIADFRKDNSKAFINVFKDFLKLCHKLKFISFKTLAIDGTKMRGQNSLNEIYKRDTIEIVEQKIEEQINNYLKELDEQDKKDQAGSFSLNKERIQEVTNRLNEQMKRRDKVALIKELFLKDPKVKRYFATDNDCRFQSDKGKIRPGYNPQTAVDDKNKLIVVAEVTNEQNDLQQLTPMVKQVREVKDELEVTDKTDVIADNGYFSEKEILNNINHDDITILVSPAAEGKKSAKQDKGKVGVSEKYKLEDFEYVKEKDTYICPEGNALKKENTRPRFERNGKEINVYRCNAKQCDNCSQKIFCTDDKHGRGLKVSANKDLIQSYIKNLETKENKRILNKRKEVVEHPFGTIKRSFGYTYFLLKGMEKVKAEFSFICFIYNLKRVLNIMPINELINAVNGISE